MLEVPEAVKTIASGAVILQLARSTPGVVGLDIGRKLSSGGVEPDTIARMQRFFAVNRRDYMLSLVMLESDRVPVQASWSLHGADAGCAWSARIHKELGAAKPYGPSDPLELFALSPVQVYERLSLGAWRNEYDMSIQDAARFLRDYWRATSRGLDPKSCFGDAWEAVVRAQARLGGRVAVNAPHVAAMLRLGYPSGTGRRPPGLHEDCLPAYAYTDPMSDVVFVGHPRSPGYVRGCESLLGVAIRMHRGDAVSLSERTAAWDRSEVIPGWQPWDEIAKAELPLDSCLVAVAWLQPPHTINA